MSNGEGIQQWKIDLLSFIEEGDSVADLGCGITTPYKEQIFLRYPSSVDFVDTRFEQCVSFGDIIQYNVIKADIFDYLNLKDHIDFIWASEFIEHFDKEKQYEIIEKCNAISKTFVFTFPTPKHHNFPLDEGHKPVVYPYLAVRGVPYEGFSWCGVITNNEKIKEFLIKAYQNKQIYDGNIENL